MIDVIIPVYNSHDKICDTLSSLAMQSVKDKVIVTLVDDCSYKDYYEEIDIFKDEFKINYLKLDSNRGPGFAREYGVKNSNNEYIVFLDSDDQFMDCFSLEILYNEINENNFDIVIGNELVEDEGININNYGSLHSKIYRRKHIEDNNIHFNYSKYSEDNSFNQIAMNTTDKVLKIDNILYIYRKNNNSITSDSNKKEKILMSYIFNMIWTVSELEKRNINEDDISYIILFTFVYTYKQIKEDISNTNYSKLYKYCYRLEDIYEKYSNYYSDDIIFDLLSKELLCDEIYTDKILDDFNSFRLKFKRGVNND